MTEPTPAAPVRFRRGRGVDLAIALLLAVAAAAGLASAPTRQYSFDAVSYAWQMQRAASTGSLGDLFHPHHLLFNSIGYLTWRIGHALTGLPRPMEAVQALNAAAGGAAVAFCYAAARQATGSRLLGLGVALLVWSSNGLWLIATDGCIYAIGFALLAATVWLGLRLLDRPSLPWAVALGASAGAATVVHQMHILLAPAVALAPLLAARGDADEVPDPGGSLPYRPATPGRLFLATVGTWLPVIAGVYYLAWMLMGHWSPSGFVSWITTYGRDGRWWNFDVAANLPLDVQALAQDFTANTSQAMAFLSHWRDGNGVYCAAIVALLIIVAWRAATTRGRHLLFCAAWILPYAAFFTVWVPGYFPFWVPTEFGLLLLASLLVEGVVRSLPDRLQRPWPAGAARAAAAALAALAAWGLWSVNGPAAHARAAPDANPSLEIAEEIRRNTLGADPATGRPSDLVLIAGPGNYVLMEVYLPYFAGRDVITLAHALKHYGPGVGKSQAEGLEWLHGVFRERWRAGAQVYVLSDVLSGRDAFNVPFAQLYGMTLEQSWEFMRGFRLERAFAVRRQPVYRVLPLSGRS